MLMCLLCIALSDAYTAVAPPDSLVTPTLKTSPSPVPLVLWNRTIAVFRSNYEELTPGDRARYGAERLNQISPNLPAYRVSAIDVLENGERVALLKVNGRLVFVQSEGDVDSARGETYESNKHRTVKAVADWLELRKRQFELPLLLRSLGMALLATMIAAFCVVALTRLLRRLLAMLDHRNGARPERFMVGGINVAPYFVSLAAGLLKILEWVLTASIIYLWLALVLSLFPYTEPWARELSAYLLGMLSQFGHGIVISIPGLFTVVVIFFISRLLVSVITRFFRAVERGAINVRWFDVETARATRRIVVVLVWVFALIIAYPMIPGSDTKAFQGVSVFLGLMLSLGSAGLVGQLIGGIVAVYTRSFQAGDYVKIGDHEGVVRELGMLAAKIVTIRKEEVTIPNALLMGSTVINYSRQARQDGAIVATSVTIGYDAPWRQVHALLLMAAGRTNGIRRQPEPFVLQKSLSDFYVEYTLMFRIERAEDRFYILSELHGHIQDAFNEYGVQIMSPHFWSQPDNDVVVPKANWHAAPAQAVGDKQGGAPS